MNIFLVILLLLQGSICSNKDLPRLAYKDMKERVIVCVAPRLPGAVDVKWMVNVSVVVDENGNVGCAEAISGHPIAKRAALDAAKQWRFKPLIVEGKAKAYTGVVSIYVSWDTEEAEKQCAKMTRADMKRHQETMKIIIL